MKTRKIFELDGQEMVEVGEVSLTDDNRIEFHNTREDVMDYLRKGGRYDLEENPVGYFYTLGLANTSRFKVGKAIGE